MFFEQITEIPTIASRTACSIFVIPDDIKFQLPTNTLRLEPADDKTTRVITVEQLRDFLALTQNRQTSDQFFVISPADAMNEAAQNAFLKTFEEPRDYYHFVLLTEQPNLLLPTIRSRAQIFQLRTTNYLDQPPRAKDKTLALAKRLISAPVTDLPELATEISKIKTRPREQALDIVGTAIELLYKSYFKTQNPKFLTKLPNFLTLYDNLAHNGHIKLHFVSDLC